MKKVVASIALLFLITVSAYAHAGHAHTYMGTVTMLHGADGFMIKTTGGKTITVQTSGKTKFLHSDNHAAKQSELAVGQRVVVKMNVDGKTAASVKMSTPKK